MESKQEDINRSITLNGQYWKIKAKLIAHYGLELHYMNKYSILEIKVERVYYPRGLCGSSFISKY